MDMPIGGGGEASRSMPVPNINSKEAYKLGISIYRSLLREIRSTGTSFHAFDNIKEFKDFDNHAFTPGAYDELLRGFNEHGRGGLTKREREEVTRFTELMLEDTLTWERGKELVLEDDIFRVQEGKAPGLVFNSKKRWNKLTDIPPPILKDIPRPERYVAPLVRALRGLGCKTEESCEGHMYDAEEGLPTYAPYVRALTDKATFEILVKLITSFNKTGKIKWVVAVQIPSPDSNGIKIEVRPHVPKDILKAFSGGDKTALAKLESEADLQAMQENAVDFALYLFEHGVKRKPLHMIRWSDNEIIPYGYTKKSESLVGKLRQI